MVHPCSCWLTAALQARRSHAGSDFRLRFHHLAMGHQSVRSELVALPFYLRADDAVTCIEGSASSWRLEIWAAGKRIGRPSV